MYWNEPEFVRRMDAFFREYKMWDDPVKELEPFWKEFREQVISAYRDSAKWIAFYNTITDIIDEYEGESE